MPVIRPVVLPAVRIGADARAAAITVVADGDDEWDGVAAVLRAITFCEANTHFVFANVHDDVHRWVPKVGTYS
ncbi:hypothetical protein ACFWQC_18280 [Nocardioides sp. NPDC058538]|uniref:hypothetical protein n=1 Tax=Nocardioides sp. NPDC058538 TaxID=3346542 RepID=UPI003664A165